MELILGAQPIEARWTVRSGADVHVAERADEQTAAPAARHGSVARVVRALVRSIRRERRGNADDLDLPPLGIEGRCLERLVAVRADRRAASRPIGRQPRVAARTGRAFIGLHWQAG